MSSDRHEDDARRALDAWDPADGPEPSADELREAGALASALDAGVSRREAAQAAVRDALEMALRARAAHGEGAAPGAVRAAAGRAVGDVMEQRRAARFLSGRGRWLAIAAAGVFAVSGAGLLSTRVKSDASRPTALDEGPGISRPAGADVFDAPLPERPGARVMDRLADARMRAYRDRVLLYGAARRAR